MTAATRSSRLLPLVAAVAAVLLAGGCSSTLRDAARVGDTHLSRASFEEELHTLAGTPAFIDFLKSQGLDAPDSEGAVDRKLATVWLQQLIQQVVIDDEFEARHLQVTGADRDAAQTMVEGLLGGAEVFSKFPRDFRREVLERYARLQALVADSAGEPPTEADARRFFRENRAQFNACESGRSVAHVLVGSREEADAVEAALAGGADFAQVAGERSIDTSTAAKGGDLGCLRANAFVPEFQAAAEAATPGVPTAPVQTQYGFHVILVSTYTPPAFADMKDQILSYLAGQAGQTSQKAVGDVLNRRLSKADVEIDPRYGTWVVDDKGPRLEPPAAPEVRDGRNPAPPTSVPPLSVAPSG